MDQSSDFTVSWGTDKRNKEKTKILSVNTRKLTFNEDQKLCRAYFKVIVYPILRSMPVKRELSVPEAPPPPEWHAPVTDHPVVKALTSFHIHVHGAVTGLWGSLADGVRFAR